jgi:coenzyme F420-reducing hydrogenase alpha subunit
MGKEVDTLISDLNIKDTFDNPFDNVVAQAVENYYFVIESIKLIDYFLKDGIDKKEPVKPPQKFGVGTAACEAPRGTLYHHYELDKDGYIIKCDIITPTVQNLPALEKDMKGLAPIIKDISPEERVKTIEMLIRAYDPCITCATH